MNVRTDYEIEQDVKPEAAKLLAAYTAYWQGKKDCTADERAAALAHVRQMRYELFRRKAIDGLGRIGLLHHLVRLRRKLGYA